MARGAQTTGQAAGLCIGRRAAGASPDPPLPPGHACRSCNGRPGDSCEDVVPGIASAMGVGVSVCECVCARVQGSRPGLGGKPADGNDYLSSMPKNRTGGLTDKRASRQMGKNSGYRVEEQSRVTCSTCMEVVTGDEMGRVLLLPQLRAAACFDAVASSGCLVSGCSGHWRRPASHPASQASHPLPWQARRRSRVCVCVCHTSQTSPTTTTICCPRTKREPEANERTSGQAGKHPPAPSHARICHL